MDIRKTRTCERCSVQTPLDKVRLIPKSQDKNVLVCMDCAEFLKKASMSRVSDITLKQPPIKNIYAPKEPLKPFVPKELRPSPGQKLKEVPPRQMFCSRCKYEFTVKAAVKVCPYCGRDDKLVRKS